MTARVDLPWQAPPLTQNQLRRMHHLAEAKAKAAAKHAAQWVIRAARLTPVDYADVVLHWRVRNRVACDADGAAPTLKVVLDALVAEHILPDDSWHHVHHTGVTIYPPTKGQPGALWLEVTPTARPA